MHATERSQGTRPLWFVLAGLETGMVAALAMLGWLALTGLWYRRSIWVMPNLLATTFYGDRALGRSLLSSTYSGIALHLFVYAAVGVLFGLLVRDSATRERTVIMGFVAGLIWYYLSFGLLWRSVNPLVPLYTPDRPMLVGHLLYGGLLGRFPVYLRSVRKQFG